MNEIRLPERIGSNITKYQQAYIDSIDNMNAQGMTMYNMLSKEQSPAAGVVWKKIEVLKTARRELLTLISLALGQVPAYSCLIWGDPGVGKSMIENVITSTICHHKKIPPKGAVYYRNTQDEFWSGYKNQAIIVLDDIGKGNPDYIVTGKQIGRAHV